MSETNQNCRLCNDCRSSFETEHRKDIAKKEINDLAEQYGKERIFGRTQIVYEKPAERICKTQVPAEKRKRLHKPRHRGRLLRLKEEEV